MRRLVAMLLPAAMLVASCGYPPQIDSSAVQAIHNVVNGKTSTRATDVRCPAGIIASYGLRFTCTYRAQPGDVRYDAQLTITAVRRGSVSFYITTEPATR